MGKNKLMQVALGKTEEEEYKPDVHKVSANLRGTCGLFFTNESEAAVTK
jgi:mRNA turnover protein 4